jgi:hypothetical protein
VSDVPDVYVPPALHDFGSLVEITRGVAFRGPEDGGSKVLDPHHSGPGFP